MKEPKIDHGLELHAAIVKAIEHSRVLSTDRTILGNSVVLEHKILVGLIQLRRQVESHNARRVAALAAPPAAEQPAPRPVVQSASLTPQNPNAPEANLDPAFQAELDRLQGKK